MNLKIDLLIDFKEDDEKLENLLSDLADTLVSNGYGNPVDEDEPLVSIISAVPLPDEEFAVEEWLKEQFDSANLLVIPAKGEKTDAD